MVSQVVIEPMTEEFILWRCLHRGPLSKETIEAWPADGPDWERRRAINMPLLTKLMRTYGTCAMLARDGTRVVGFLRFYPKWLYAHMKAGLCMQQDSPEGPSEDLVEERFAPLEEIEDKMLTVHCMMTGSPFQTENRYLRKGIGTRLAQGLLSWAEAQGWRGIEATAYEGLDILYANTGQAGVHFWERLGFQLVRTEKEPALAEDNAFVRKMREEARAVKIDPEKISNRYVMRLELG